MPHPDLADAILRTLLYADVFDYPLTPREMVRYLIGRADHEASVERALAAAEWPGARIVRVNGYVAVRGREALAEMRDRRSRASEALWRKARRWATLNCALPFVRMVAVTGALAMDNSEPDDDIDFLLVTRPGRVWLARAFSILLVRLARLDGTGLCPNYVLAETSLAQRRRDLFTAHELAQMVPLAGHEVYERMLAENGWVRDFLPNAAPLPHDEPDRKPRGVLRAVQALFEWLLSGRLGDRLEAWERRRKIRKFASEAARPGADALLDAEHVKGHFDDYGARALAAYRFRLKSEGLAE